MSKKTDGSRRVHEFTIYKFYLTYTYRRTVYPTGTDPESGSRSQVGPGIEPILKLQDSESYRNRGFWNRSNTRKQLYYKVFYFTKP